MEIFIAEEIEEVEGPTTSADVHNSNGAGDCESASKYVEDYELNMIDQSHNRPILKFFSWNFQPLYLFHFTLYIFYIFTTNNN